MFDRRYKVCYVVLADLAGTLLMRQSHSAQSDVCVVIVDPSAVAYFPTAIAVHWSLTIALVSSRPLLSLFLFS